MNAAGVLQLLGRLEEEHRVFGKNASEPPQVLPVTHDAPAVDAQLLERAFERMGGRLFQIDASSPLSVKGEVNAVVAQTIHAACEQNGCEQISLSAEAGDIRARFDDGGEESESARITLATVVRLAGAELSARPLVGVTVPVGPLDFAHRNLLWDLLVRHLPPKLSHQIGTLVPVFGGAPDLRRQCSGTPSLRFAIIREAFHARARQSAANAALEQICPSLEKPLVLFLGAGASASANVSLGDTLRDDALRELLPADQHGTLAKSFHEWLFEHHRLLSSETGGLEEFAGSLTLERVLREEFRLLTTQGKTRAESRTIAMLGYECEQARERMPDGRKALRQIITQHPRLVIVTVNLDWQVEDGLDHPHVVYRNEGEFARAVEHVAARVRGDAPDAGLPVLKIHGSIDDLESLVVDVDALEMGLGEHAKAVLNKIFDAAAEAVQWVWIGSSMRDRDVNAFFRQGPEVAEWWVDPLPGPGFRDFMRDYRDGIVPERDDRLISELADSFLPKLAGRIEELVASGGDR